jgi:hypothetical protein
MLYLYTQLYDNTCIYMLYMYVIHYCYVVYKVYKQVRNNIQTHNIQQNNKQTQYIVYNNTQTHTNTLYIAIQHIVPRGGDRYEML